MDTTETPAGTEAATAATPPPGGPPQVAPEELAGWPVEPEAKPGDLLKAAHAANVAARANAAPQPGPMHHSFGEWAEDELRHVEELAERIAAKVHAKLEPLLAPFNIGDVAKILSSPELTPVIAAAKAAVEATPVAREFKCITDLLPCPMHGVVHES